MYSSLPSMSLESTLSLIWYCVVKSSVTDFTTLTFLPASWWTPRLSMLQKNTTSTRCSRACGLVDCQFSHSHSIPRHQYIFWPSIWLLCHCLWPLLNKKVGDNLKRIRYGYSLFNFSPDFLCTLHSTNVKLEFGNPEFRISFKNNKNEHCNEWADWVEGVK